VRRLLTSAVDIGPAIDQRLRTHPPTDRRPRTVTKHLEHVFEKLGVETRTAAARMAMERLRQDMAPAR
jgi:hypothetical protein